jgi:ATP-dependent RNA helicase SUPV3L1/SUV3
VEGHHVGQLRGFRFSAESGGEGPDAKAARAAAQKALAAEIEARSVKCAASANSDFALESNGIIRWLGEPVGKLAADEVALKPRVILLADEQLSGIPRDKVANRLERWIGFHIEALLKPLVDLSSAKEIDGLARGVAYRLVENLGVVDRRDIASDIRALDQDARGLLRRRGVRFGAYHIFIPILLKPAPAALATLLWALKNDQMEAEGLVEIPQISAAGRTSVAVDKKNLPEFYRLSGFRILGKKAVRVDILERLADLIRPCIMWREGGEPPRPEPSLYRPRTVRVTSFWRLRYPP